MTLTDDITQRIGLTAQVYACLQAHRNEWVSVRDLAELGGYCGWRTRVSDARKVAAKVGDVIEWNRNVKASAYRLCAKPMGRDSTVPAPTDWPTFDAPYSEPWSLT